MGTFITIILILMAALQTAFCIIITATNCVDSCVGLTDGDYQYCPDCHKFVSCSNSYKYIMPCPSNLVWDDVMKRCEYTSNTCGSTTTNRTTTTTTTTPKPPPDGPCCIRERMNISLGNDVPIVNGSVPFISVLDSTNGRNSSICDTQLLLKATFGKNNLTEPCQGCTKVPQCGNKMLRIDLKMSPVKTGFSFHVGDSRTNNGYRGDAGTQTNDAEFHSLGYGHLLYGSDRCPSWSESLTGLLDAGATGITIYVGNEFIRITNNLGYVYELCSSCLFALNGQAESEGLVNEDIYIGLNRIIASPSYREGTGVCDAVISWTCPWN